MSAFNDDAVAVVAEAEAILDALKVERAVALVAAFAGRPVAELDAGEVDRLWRAAGEAFFTVSRFRDEG